MAPDPTQTPLPPTSNRFFDWMRGLGIVRTPGWIGGVCAGIAARLGIDAVIVRGIAVVVAVLGGPALLLYAAAWLLLPDLDDRIHLERLLRGTFDRAAVGIGVLVLLAFLPVTQGFWYAGSAFWGAPYWNVSIGRALWTLIVIGLIVALVVWFVRRPDADAAGPIARPDTAAATAARTDALGFDTVPADASTAPPVPPAAPAADAPADELAAWKEQQAAFKREHDEWKTQQAASERAIAKERAEEQRRIRQQEAEARREAWLEHNRRTRSNPLYTLTAIGVALIAGAAVTLSLALAGLTLSATMTGMAVTLAVLGLAIMINGFRGKRSGGSSALAVLVAIALGISSLFLWISGPVIQNQSVAWSPSYSAAGAHRTVINGAVDLDLTDYFARTEVSAATGANDGRVTLVVLNGSVDVTVPADEFSRVRANAINGQISSADGSQDGPFVRVDTEFTPVDPGPAQHPQIDLQLWILNGDVTLTQAKR